jgi:hypothetical protein
MTHGVTIILPHGGADEGRLKVQRAKDMYQRKIRFPEEICLAIQNNGDKQCRQFNTEVIYQLRKAYGLIEKRNDES